MDNETDRLTWRRKRNRLDRDVYRGPGAFSVTVSTWNRERAFTDAAEVQRCWIMLEDAARDTAFRLLAYCFMPDHVHLLVEGSEGSDLARLMKRFKQASSFDYKRRMGQPLWQRSYYDHVLRGPDELRPAIEYMLSNPVQAGLVEDAHDYPFAGGELVGERQVAT